MCDIADKETMINYAVRALQVLAADARVQVTLYPPFCCPLYEVSQEGDPELPALMGNYKDELTEVQRRAVEKLQAELQATTEADVDCHGGPRKTELELPPDKRWWREREALENPHWTKVRLLAREALTAFNRERQDPVPARETRPNMWEGPSDATRVPIRGKQPEESRE